MEFVQRCATIGAAVWVLGPDAEILSKPSPELEGSAILHSDAITNKVVDAVRASLEQEDQATREIAPGFWVTPVYESRRRHLITITVFATLGHDFLGSELHRQAASEISSESAQDDLNKICIHNTLSAQQAASLLAWSFADAIEAAKVNSALDTFGQQLTDAFEEVSLLYNLGRAMHHIAHPHRYIDRACEELRSTLRYSWVAVVFPVSSRSSMLVGRSVMTHGDAPLTHVALSALATRYDSEFAGDDFLVIPESAIDPRAPDHGTVLMHVIRRNDTGVQGMIIAGGKQGDEPTINTIDLKMTEVAATFISISLENAGLYDDQQAMFLGTIDALTASIDAKDPYTRGHSQRVAYLAYQLGIAYGVSEDEAERIRISGVVHDIGKIGVPEAVLTKPGRLTDEEFEQIKRHPEVGHSILCDIPNFQDILPGVLYHHERYDGKGYPQGIAGTDIPLIARIIGLADAFDAMSSTRTYRSAMDREHVLDQVRKGRGTQFDPDLADVFLTLDFSQYDEMVARHQSETNIEAPDQGREAA